MFPESFFPDSKGSWALSWTKYWCWGGYSFGFGMVCWGGELNLDSLLEAPRWVDILTSNQVDYKVQVPLQELKLLQNLSTISHPGLPVTGAMCILDGAHRLKGDALCALAPLLQEGWGWRDVWFQRCLEETVDIISFEMYAFNYWALIVGSCW